MYLDLLRGQGTASHLPQNIVVSLDFATLKVALTDLGQLGHDALLVAEDELRGGAEVDVVAHRRRHVEAQHVTSAAQSTGHELCG